MSTTLIPIQRCEEIRALLSFERPEDPETNELEWQSFLLQRHESYTKFPYDSDDEEVDTGALQAQILERESYSSSDAKSELEIHSFLPLTALPSPPLSPQFKPIEVQAQESLFDTSTINTRIHITLTQTPHSPRDLQLRFDSELALLTARYDEFSTSISLAVKDGERGKCHTDTYEFISDTLSLCALFLTFPMLECHGMKFAELLKMAFWLAHTSNTETQSPLLALLCLRLLSLTVHLFHPDGIPGTPATPHPNSILHSYYHIDLYEKAACVFEEAGMVEVAEKYMQMARWGWMCVGGDEGGI